MANKTDDSIEPLEPIAYLSRSENRFQVLEALTETIPKPGLESPGYEPRELREITGTSETTLSRILNEFDERGWAERAVGGEYTATPLGQSIAIEFAPLITSIEAIQHLGDALALLPLNELTIGLEHFADATIEGPSPGDPRFFGRYLGELLSETSTFHALSYVAAPAGIGAALEERTGTEDVAPDTLGIDVVLVLAERIIDRIDDRPGAREANLGMLEAGVRMYTHDGHLPCNLFVTDDKVVIENSQVQGVRDGTVVESQNGVVREWALEVFERYRGESEEVTVEDLPE